MIDELSEEPSQHLLGVKIVLNMPGEPSQHLSGIKEDVNMF